MSQDSIRAQIDAMPEGRKKELAEYMLAVYRGESDMGWVDDPRYDLLDAPQWEPPADGQTSWSRGDAISVEQHERLDTLRERAGGWFYLKDEELKFVTLDEWEKIKSGEQEL